MAITWKNIEGPDFRGAQQGVAAAGDAFANAFKGLETFANDRNALADRNFNAQMVANEQGAREALMAATATPELAAEFDFTKFMEGRDNLTAASRAALLGESKKRPTELLRYEESLQDLANLDNRAKQLENAAKKSDLSVESLELGNEGKKLSNELSEKTQATKIAQGKANLKATQQGNTTRQFSIDDTLSTKQGTTAALDFMNESMNPNISADDMLENITNKAAQLYPTNKIARDTFISEATKQWDSYNTVLGPKGKEKVAELNDKTALRYNVQGVPLLASDGSPATSINGKSLVNDDGTPLVSSIAQEDMVISKANAVIAKAGSYEQDIVNAQKTAGDATQYMAKNFGTNAGKAKGQFDEINNDPKTLENIKEGIRTKLRGTKMPDGTDAYTPAQIGQIVDKAKIEPGIALAALLASGGEGSGLKLSAQGAYYIDRDDPDLNTKAYRSQLVLFATQYYNAKQEAVVANASKLQSEHIKTILTGGLKRAENSNLQTILNEQKLRLSALQGDKVNE